MDWVRLQLGRRVSRDKEGQGAQKRQCPLRVGLHPSQSPQHAGSVARSIGVKLDLRNFFKECIALADCDDFFSTRLCFYDEGEAACFYSSRFVILKNMDIERWKCAAVLFKETLSSATCADDDGLLESYEPDW